MSEEKQETKEVKTMELNDNGMALGTTVNDRYNLAKIYCQSGMLPKEYNTPEKAMIGIQYSMELGFRDQPLTAMKNIAVINGMPSLWGELPLALVYKSGELELIDEFFVNDKNDKLPPTCDHTEVNAAVCIVKRKGYDSREFAFTRSETIGLGVAAIWTKYFKIMIKRKARAIALKDTFPDVLLGITIGEYDLNTVKEEVKGDYVEVDTDKIKAREITEKFQGSDE